MTSSVPGRKLGPAVDDMRIQGPESLALNSGQVRQHLVFLDFLFHLLALLVNFYELSVAVIPKATGDSQQYSLIPLGLCREARVCDQALKFLELPAPCSWICWYQRLSTSFWVHSWPQFSSGPLGSRPETPVSLLV